MRGTPLKLAQVRPLFCLTFFVLGSLFQGCATGGAVRNVEGDVGRVGDQLHDISARLAAVDSLAQSQEVESRRRWTELSVDVSDVSRRVRQIQAKMDEAARRLADLARGLEAVQLYSGGKVAAGKRSSSGLASADTAKTPESRPPLVPDVRALYDLASNDMQDGNYALAIPEFSQLLESFPESDLADNAAYWLGECYFAQKEYPKAIDFFRKVIADFPGSEKVPAAMLKLGDAYLKTNKRRAGIQQFRDLIKTYPDSEEAKQAKGRLKSMG